MSGLVIEQIAPGASIQDLGRPGFARFGVTGGGALDCFALHEGQILLGNETNAAALELPGFGGRFRAESLMNVALSGAEMTATLNGAPQLWRCSFQMREGDVLNIGTAIEGVYGYLHVEGGFATEHVLGSRSTHLRAGFGLVPKPGVILPIEAQSSSFSPQALPRQEYFDQRFLRVLRGPQSGYFPSHVFDQFVSGKFTVSDKRDRMGIRLIPTDGPVDAGSGLLIASDAINLGDIQITGDGTPAILLADRGSSGGYPRIAALASVDLDAAAQMPSGTRFQMQLIDRNEAIAALKARQVILQGLSRQRKNISRDPRDIADLLSYNLVGGIVSAKEPQ